ncbi:hypothetical protein ACQ2H7_004593 [Candidozyma auris]
MLRSQRYMVLLIFTVFVTFLIITSSSAHSYIKESKVGKSVSSYVDTAKSWANSKYADSSLESEEQEEASKLAEAAADADGKADGSAGDADSGTNSPSLQPDTTIASTN